MGKNYEQMDEKMSLFERIHSYKLSLEKPHRIIYPFDRKKIEGFQDE
jgi:hypothetical protein